MWPTSATPDSEFTNSDQVSPSGTITIQCEYHNGSMGHSIEDRKTFKGKVRKLIECKHLVFEEDNLDVKCGYYTGNMGHVVKECEGFRRKLQKLVKKESPSMNG